jgi:hypothetical protein
MKRLKWDEIDKCETAYEVAELMRKNGIRGIRYSTTANPLARATGWIVDYYDACRGRHSRELTAEEKIFLRLFHDGKYQELIEEGET